MPDDHLPGCIAIVTGANLGRGAPGGTRSYVLGLSAFLAARDIRVVLLANGPVDDAPSECEVIEVTRKHMASSAGFQHALRAWSRRIARLDADVAHFQRPDDILALSPRVRIPPAICTLHGNPNRGVRRRHGRLLSVVYSAREARALRKFRTIIAVDENTAAWYRRQYPLVATLIHVVPVAVGDTSHQKKKPEPSRAETGGPTTFLYAGRLSVEKRVDGIIAAFREVGIRDSRLLIAGTGPEGERLRRLAAGQNVEFLGNVPHDAMLEYYRRADVLVLASQYEGLPTVALESLASGCPVVATESCGLDSILDNRTGIIVNDLDTLPAAMRKAARLRETGTEIAVPEQYTWSSVGPQILALYAAATLEATE